MTDTHRNGDARDRPPPRWRLTLEARDEGDHFGYKVAGIVLDSALALALPWTVDAEPGTATTAGSQRARRVTWDGSGWLGGRWRAVRSFHGEAGYDLEIEGFGRAFVRPAARRLHIAPAAGVLDAYPALVQEVVLGPVVALALAHEGVFCLHAGCVRIGASAVGFLGDSGSGKSTLSRPAGPSWRRVCDDVMPIDATGRHALPRFPQLKLPADAQYPAGDPERQPLGALLDLAPEIEAAATCPIGGARRATREAVLTLVRHTVASKLFARGLLDQHLTWCESVASAMPVYDWVHPHDRARLDEARRAVAGMLASASGPR